MQGRKRHLLVDTLGLLIAVKVLAADSSDREGAKVLLRPLAGKTPRLQLIWVETGYDGKPFQRWVQQHLEVRLEVVKHPWTGIHGVWAPEGTVIDWDKVLPKGFHVLKRPSYMATPPPMKKGRMRRRCSDTEIVLHSRRRAGSRD
ncbi:MAG: transposase [Ktedonobacteraceae bacterium]